MSRLFLLTFIILVSCSQNKKIERTNNVQTDILTQYAFKVGKWKLKTKFPISPGKYREGTGSSHVYLDTDGKTYIEDMVLDYGNGYVSKSRATFSYNEQKKLWVNTYQELNKKEITQFYGKLRNGVMTEFVGDKDELGEFEQVFTYFNIGEDKYSYKGVKHYKKKDIQYMSWYFDAERD